ncbi:MAG: hypothetical protein FWD14_02300 [Treponema sp.]|nr:hypothetical protein [Treponema sp.]
MAVTASNEEFNWKEELPKKDFIEFPETLNKRCTPEEFHKLITSHNSDIHINTVNFREHPDVKMG